MLIIKFVYEQIGVLTNEYFELKKTKILKKKSSSKHFN
jgi:hypothetical protein